MVNISIIIVNYNTKNMLKDCLNSIIDNINNLRYEIIVIDNASCDGSYKMVLNDFPKVNLIQNEINVGFAKANNQGIKVAKGKYILLLNSDTILLKNSIANVYNFLEENENVGIATCKVLGEDMMPQYWASRNFPNLWTEFCLYSHLSNIFPNSKIFSRYMMSNWNCNSTREVDVIQGAYMMIRNSPLKDVGLLDERFFMYAEDIDLCYRFYKNGWKIFFVHTAEIIHYGGGSSRKISNKMYWVGYYSMYLYFKKHYGTVYANLYKFLRKIISFTYLIILYARKILKKNVNGKMIIKHKGILISPEGYKNVI